MGGLLGGLIVISLVYSLVNALDVYRVVSGSESKGSYLSRQPGNYSAVEFITKNLSTHSRVYMMWDGKGYYCDDRCLPDAEQGQWTYLISSVEGVDGVTDVLKKRGVTHLLLGGDVGFILKRDPYRRHQEALDFFI